MKTNMLLIIGLVFVMMLGVTGTARSGTGDTLKRKRLSMSYRGRGTISLILQLYP